MVPENARHGRLFRIPKTVCKVAFLFSDNCSQCSLSRNHRLSLRRLWVNTLRKNKFEPMLVLNLKLNDILDVHLTVKSASTFIHLD